MGNSHGGTRGWLVLDEILAASGDATAAAHAGRPTGSSPVAAAAAAELRARGAAVTRDSRARWVADPGDPVVAAWRLAMAEAVHDG